LPGEQSFDRFGWMLNVARNALERLAFDNFNHLICLHFQAGLQRPHEGLKRQQAAAALWDAHRI
jgi:hypothetical protein